MIKRKAIGTFMGYCPVVVDPSLKNGECYLAVCSKRVNKKLKSSSELYSFITFYRDFNVLTVKR